MIAFFGDFDQIKQNAKMCLHNISYLIVNHGLDIAIEKSFAAKGSYICRKKEK